MSSIRLSNPVSAVVAPAAPTKEDTGRRSLGQSVVEFALVLPIMLVLMLLAIDFGRALATWVQITNAAREAAAYGAGNPTDIAGIQARAQAEVNSQGQMGEGDLVVTVACINAAGHQVDCAFAGGGSGAGSTVTVTTTEQFTFLTPIIGDLFGGHVTLGYSVAAPVLILAPTGGGAPSDCTTMPVASFTATVQGGTVTLDASASSPTTGVCAISGYNWNMGDGLNPFPPIVDRNATYTYSQSGGYDVSLTVTNPAGTNTTWLHITVGSGPSPTPSPSPTPAPSASPTAPPPVCNTAPSFTYAFTGNGNGEKKHQMTFYGAYTGQPAPATWTWDFGDGSASGSGVTTSRNYEDAGTYTVTLTVRNGSCVATTHQTVVVP